MKLLALPVALAIAANASGEILYRVSDSFWVWNGGSAYRSGNLWVGGGWDTFPGVSPPWNPVTPPPPAAASRKARHAPGVRCPRGTVAELLPTRASRAHHAVHPHRQRADPPGAEPLIAHGLEPPSPTTTMPTLPSGRTLALSMNHILPPSVVTFK
jgi:hypothetical protein